jgi:RNA polymerase sigma-70 factor (ECF subfamily)
MDRSRHLFWQLTEPEHLRARAFCRKLMANRDDGDDLYQDALVAALTRFEGLREIEAFRSWLYQIIVNAFKNRMRRPWYRRFRPLTSEMAETMVGNNPVEGQAVRRKLKIAFRAVTPEDKALVTLFELEGWPIEAIARMQHISQGAVKMRLSRARKKMRVALVKHRLRTSGANPKAKLREDKLCVATKPAQD